MEFIPKLKDQNEVLTWSLSTCLKTVEDTSIIATREAAIIAKTSPALKEGRPHWNGYGTLILHKWGENRIVEKGIRWPSRCLK